MDTSNENINNDNIRADLNEDETSKLVQFKDLTGIDELKCLQILRANDWRLEVALDLALDGAYNEDHSVYQNSSNNNDNSIINNQLRHRHGTGTTQPESVSTNTENNSSNQPSEPQNSQLGLTTVIWNASTWLFKLPFIIVINTLNTVYDFFRSMFFSGINIDQTGTVDRFISEFEEKYGTRHPTFFRGSYTQLLDQGKREIRFALLYIHSPLNRDADRFCNDIISSQRFVDYINEENILFWACASNYPEGYKVVQSFRVNSYPFMALFGLRNNRMLLLKNLIVGYDLETFVAQLRMSVSRNQFSLIAARAEKEERDMSNLIRAQQDVAFEESLKADQEKERKRKEVEAKKAEEERLQREKEDAVKLREAKIKALKSTLLDRITEEPDSTNTDSIRIMFKLPNGKRLERRFYNSDPVKYLYYFVYCNEESLINFKIRTNFPTRDLPGSSPQPDTDLDDSSEENEMNCKVAKCDLGNNVMLFVHDLDS